MERMIKKDELHFTGEEAKNLQDKFKKLEDFVQKNPPDYFDLKKFAAWDKTCTHKLQTLLLQLIGEERKEKLTPFEQFCIDAVSFIYPIGMPREYENDKAFVENWRIFQAKNLEYFNKNYPEMGLEKIEADILKLVGFASVIPGEERDSIKNEIFYSPDVSIKSTNIPFLEAIIKLAALLVIKVPCRQTGNSMIEDIKIDHPNQKIVIEATYPGSYEKKTLERFSSRVHDELKSLRKVLETNHISLNKVTLDARAEELVPPIDEEHFFGRQRAVEKILLLSEEKKISIVTASPGVGITTTLQCGVEPALRNLGAYVIYCSVDKGFQQSILRTLDQLFPNTWAKNIFTKLDKLSSKNHLLVFILDDFEKIFTIDDSKLTMEMLRFLKEFEKLESSNNRIIIGIKDDFLGNLYQFSKEIHKFYTEKAFYYLKNFDSKSAREVMVNTIEQMNFPVDEQLIETMLDDLTQIEDTIYPPLIHTIFNQLIKRHRARYLYRSKKNPFNSSFYRDTGGAASLLLDDARERLEEFREEEQGVSIEIIQKMITPFPTSQRMRMRHQEILELNDNRVDIEKLLQQLLRVRFIKRIQTTSGYEYELIHDYLKGFVPKKTIFTDVEDTSSFIREAIAYIDDNYDRQISLQEVAKKVGVTPEYLSRQFKVGLKIGFKEYITQKRIEEAKLLLIHFPELPINELSQKTGFASPQHFINVFKSETHYTPLKFRQKSLANPDSVDQSNIRSH